MPQRHRRDRKSQFSPPSYQEITDKTILLSIYARRRTARRRSDRQRTRSLGPPKSLQPASGVDFAAIGLFRPEFHRTSL
ncbi:hypothetical protein BLAT2472_140061 [Burkholderia latens]